jgi:erythromycin esterase-like protein
MSDATIIREVVQPLTGSAQDYDSLLALIGDARFVLLGEASHGTHEFYLERGDHEAAYCGGRLHCCRD